MQGDRAHRKQKVDIHFNFIGNFVPPKQEPEAPALTVEQPEAERKKEARREREREQNRLRMRRVKAAQKAALQTENSTEKMCVTITDVSQQAQQKEMHTTRAAI